MIIPSVRHLKELLEINTNSLMQDNSRLHFLIENKNEDWSTEPELLEVIYSYIITKKPHTIVEIGTYKGISALVFAEACRINNYGTVYTIDDGSAISNQQARSLFDSREIDNLVCIEKTSKKAFEDWGRAEIDLLYIDGDHSYASACIDFALWGRLIEQNGLVIMHDTRTRLTRHFPDDYIFPIEYFDVLNIKNVECRPSGHEWEGAAFIRKKRE